jgi:hypothetical protein
MAEIPLDKVRNFAEPQGDSKFRTFIRSPIIARQSFNSEQNRSGL